MGYRVQGLGFRVQVRVLDSGCRVQGAGCMMQGFGMVCDPDRCVHPIHSTRTPESLNPDSG